MLRVVFVLPSFAGGGAERVMLTLFRDLDRTRFSPVLVVINGTGPLAALLPSSVVLHDLRCTRLRFAIPRLLAILRRLQPEVIVSTLGYLNLAVLALRPLLPATPRVFVREANTPSQSLPATPWPSLFRLGYRWLYPSADGVICQSRAMAGEMHHDYAVPEQRLLHLANPVDVPAIRRTAMVPHRFPGSGLRFVAAGRLTCQKGFDRLLEMFVNMPEDAHVTIFGEGQEKQQLAALAARLGVDKKIHWAGFDPVPWATYAGADAFLLPSRWEGMPNAALEALACGTPVIATPESGGMREIAAEVEPGGVSIAEAGGPFITAMLAVRPFGRPSLRYSLLPPSFTSESVIAEFSAMLLESKQT